MPAPCSTAARARPGAGLDALTARPRAYARAHRERFVNELQTFVRFATVSTRADHRRHLVRCGRWLTSHLAQVLGLEHARVLPAPGPPLVYADWLRRPGAPTLLVHGHYDVQPPDEQDRLPPFAGVVRDGAVYGRGASDDKGQLLAHLKGLESWLRSAGTLPINVKVLIEGQEEIGSPNLATALARHARTLKADLAVISDSSMPSRQQPALTYAMRGALGLHIELSRSGPQLHAGTFGGAVVNPLHELARLLATLQGDRGRIAVPGFYDQVRPLGDAERAYLARTGPDDRTVLADAGAPAGRGEAGHTLYERLTTRPALTVTGMSGGYAGPGTKAVLPQRAEARLDLRLVPDQQSEAIERLIGRHLERLRPPGLTLSVKRTFAVAPFSMDRNHAVMGVARRALEAAFGVPPVFCRNGGSLPAAGLLQDRLGIPVLLMGFGLPHDRIHGPDEKFELGQLFRGIDAAIALLGEAGEDDHAMIIDCHCHAGTGDGLTGPWDTAAPLDKYLRRARRAGIRRTVVFAAFSSDYRAANREVAALVRRHPDRLWGFAFVNPAADRGRIAALVQEAVEAHGFRGIKVHRQDARITREVCAAARVYRLPVLYDPMGELGTVELIAAEYPDVSFIIPHLSSFSDDWRAQVAFVDQLARMPNLYTDTSGVRRFDLLERAVMRAGASKILFGTDGPWLHPAVELAKVRALRLPAEQERLVVGGNLLRLMGAEAPSLRRSAAPLLVDPLRASHL